MIGYDFNILCQKSEFKKSLFFYFYYKIPYYYKFTCISKDDLNVFNCMLNYMFVEKVTNWLDDILVKA